MSKPKVMFVVKCKAKDLPKTVEKAIRALEGEKEKSA